MDIPLPEDPPAAGECLENIPVPDDANRYSPSLPIEDDPPDLRNDLSVISLPSGPEKQVAPTVSVLGKEAAKKRLLAFSLSKQSLQSQKKIKLTNDILSGKDIPKDGDPKNVFPKKKKKGVLDKARDTISEIEEIKRKENEVRESMQLHYPLWSLDAKVSSVPSLILPDGIEKSDKLETMVEKLIIKKNNKDKKELERIEREEERRRKREKREKERRRLSPHSWSEFTKSGFKAYHFRRVKYKREKLTDSKHGRSRHNDYEREGPKKINLLDTPMVLKKSVIATSINNEEIEFPSWAVKHTITRPRISYCYNPKQDRTWFISRREMLSTLPDNIYQIVKTFFSTTCLNRCVVHTSGLRFVSRILFQLAGELESTLRAVSA